MQSVEKIFTGQILAGHTGAVYGAAYSPDGRYIASGSGDMTVRLWDTTTGKLAHVFTGHTGAIYGIAFSPDGRFILSGSKDQTARLWDIQTGRTIRIFGTKISPIYSPGHYGAVNAVAYSPDGRNVATVGDFSARVVDGPTGSTVRAIWLGSSCGVFSVAYSPDGKYLLVGCNDQTAHLWAIQNGSEVRRFKRRSS